MLIYAYVFALVLGAILLGASFLLGGDHDADHSVDGHLEVGHELDGHADAGHATHGDVGGLFGVLSSIRFWTFFAAFFGLTGIVLDGLELADKWIALGCAIAVGFVTGYTAVTLIRRLSGSDNGVAAGVNDYIGKSGEMLIGSGPGRLGKIRIELKGTTVDVLAESDEPIPRGDQALIHEMRGSKAVVTKLDPAR